MVLFYKMEKMIWKKCNEIQLTKNQMDLNNQKMTNHLPTPEISIIASGHNMYNLKNTVLKN